MEFLLAPAALLFFVAAFISFSLSWLAWRRRHIRGSHTLGLLMLMVCIWSLADGASFSVSTVEAKMFYGQFGYLGGYLAMPLLLNFVVQISHLEWQLPRYVWYLLFAPFMAIVVLAFTNRWHSLIWTEVILLPDNRAIFRHGAAYIVGNVLIYLVVLAVFAVLTYSYIRASVFERHQLRLVFLAILFPAIGNALYLIHLPPFSITDFTSATLSFSGVVLLYAIYGHQFLDVVPVARNTLVEWMSDSVLVLDQQNRVIDLNNAMRIHFGIGPGDQGKPISEVFAASPELVEFCEQDERRTMELVVSSPRWVVFDVRLTFLYDWRGVPTGRGLIFRDISRRYRAEQELEQRMAELTELKDELLYQTQHDGLTKAHNRRYLMQQLPKLLAEASEAGEAFAVLLLDIDKFKLVNDTLGHQAGDQVLIDAVAFFRSLVSPDGIVSRYGGEEFVIVEPVGEANALELAERLRTGFRDCITVKDAPSTTISIGVSIFPDHAQDIEALLDAADEAMYVAKRAGGNRVALYQALQV